VESATNPVDGVRIAFRRFDPPAGTTPAGPAVVLVHGSALSQVIWRGLGFVRELGADRPVVTLDLRGHGRSGKPHEDAAYSPHRMASDVVAVLDEAGLDQVDYVGYSLGGRVGFALLDEHPHRVRRFVSVAGSAANRPGAFDRLFFPGCTAAVETGGMEGFLARWQAHSGPIDPQTRSALAANDPLALAAYLRAGENEDGVAAERLPAITNATLLLVGDQDDERLAAAEHLVAVLPAARLDVLAGAGHGDVLRHPGALPAVRAFLTPALLDRDPPRAPGPQAK
jgi:pimeloyl-ACP methyl ester carboxylesterase